MKTLFFIFCLAVSAGFVNAQTATYDIAKVKTAVATTLKVSESAITTLKILEFGAQRFAYVKLTKDGRPVTGALSLVITDGGTGIGIGGSITCSGDGCAECDIMGLPDPTQVYCSCLRPTREDGYCNMSKTIGL